MGDSMEPEPEDMSREDNGCPKKSKRRQFHCHSVNILANCHWEKTESVIKDDLHASLAVRESIKACRTHITSLYKRVCVSK